MNTNSQTSTGHNFNLDSVANVGVILAGLLVVASAAFSTFTNSTDSATQLARRDQAASRVVATVTKPTPITQQAASTLVMAQPILVNAMR